MKRTPAELAILVSTVAAALIGAPCPAQVDFATHRTIPIDGDSWVIRVADFDEDGRADLAVPTGYLHDSVTVLLGRGLARFDRGDHPVGLQPLDLAVADFDGDGHLDLAAASSLSHAITVRLGDGSGGFGPAVDYPSGGNHPHRLAAGRFDGDEHLDLLSSNYVGDSVTLLRGNGDGSFSTGSPVLSLESPEEIVAGDLDGDARPDFVISRDETEDLEIYLGDGEGRFHLEGLLATRFPVKAVLLDDFDADGNLDLAASGSAPEENLRIFLGDGSARFVEAQILSLGSGPRRSCGANALFARDLDGDGILDLTAALNCEAYALLGDGKGTFAIHQRVRAPVYSMAVAAADVDGDDVPDLLLGDDYQDRDSLWIQRGLGGGSFEQSTPTDVARAGDVVLREDFDGDGHLDIAVGRHDDGFSVHHGDGTGSFDRAQVFAGLPRSRGLASADFDLDGRPDLAYATDDGVRIYLGDAEGLLRLHDTIPIPYGSDALAAGSFTDRDDAFPDLLLAEQEALGISCLQGDGTGHFEFGARFEAPDANSLAVGDFDEDGHLDVAIGRDGETLRVRFGNGFGVFPGLVVLFPPGGSKLVRAADLDDDGHLDLAGTSPGGSFFAYFGDGSGGFGPGHFVAQLSSGTPLSHAVGDFDDDGRLDAAVGTDLHRLVVLRNRGDRTFEVLDGFGMEAHEDGVVSGDFDEDGRADLVASRTNWSEWDVAFLRNVSFHPRRCRFGNVNAEAGAVADVLLVNGSPGEGPSRRVAVGIHEPLVVRMEAPPSTPGGPARFALYAYLADPSESTVTRLPHGLGFFCMETFLTVPHPWRLERTWNNIGRRRLLGEPDLPSEPAPSVVVSMPGGPGVPVTAFLQGLILDPGAPSGRAGVTNGVLVSVP
jgi:hypothetical protein